MKKVVQLLFVFGIGGYMLWGQANIPMDSGMQALLCIWGGLLIGYGIGRTLLIILKKLGCPVKVGKDDNIRRFCGVPFSLEGYNDEETKD